MPQDRRYSSEDASVSPAALGSFRLSDFEDPNFDAKEYVDRTSRSVSLDRLMERLQLYVEQVRADLVNAINEDYPELIALSDQLSNINGAVVCIRAPLLKLKESLADVQETYKQELQSLTDCLQRQAQVHHAKTMLELIQDATAATAKVEALMQELPPISADLLPATDTRTPEALLSDAKHLERISSELSRLNFYESKGSALPLVAALRPRVAAATAHLNSAARATLAATLACQHADAVEASRRCITSCCAIGNIALVHETVRSAMMRPTIEAAAAETLNALGGGTGEAAPAVAVELAPLLRSVQQRVAPLVARLGEAVAERAEVAQSFDILGACVLAEVHALIKANLPGAFSSAVPAAFHANYAAATAFLKWLAASVPVAATVALFHRSPECAAFMKEWNLSVYFSLRFQEIAGAVEEAFHTGPAPAAAGADKRFALRQSGALFAGLARCRDPSVTFPAVYERFYKLQLQLVLRYAAWVHEAGGVWGADGEGGTGAPKSAEFLGFEAGSMRDWAQDAEPPALLQLLVELNAVGDALRREEAGRVAAQLDGVISSSDISVISAGFEESVKKLEESSSVVGARIVSLACASARAALLHVRSIAAMYKAPARPGPLHYVANLLRSAQALTTNHSWASISEAQQQDILSHIIASVAGLLKQACAELLESSAKTQASLSKFRKGAADADGGLSSVAKIRAQLRLDAGEFCRLSEKLAPSVPARLREVQELMDVVQGDDDRGSVAGVSQEGVGRRLDSGGAAMDEGKGTGGGGLGRVATQEGNGTVPEIEKVVAAQSRAEEPGNGGSGIGSAAADRARAVQKDGNGVFPPPGEPG